MNFLYDKALNLSRNIEAKPSAIERVAKETSPEAARWAFTQWALRKKASAKFKLADAMLFDRDGMEMSTGEEIAAYHANLFPTRSLVYDLTVGIGADLIALARRGLAIGYELDPVRAEYARHNLTVHGLEAEVRNESSDSLESAEYFFADPSRRSAGQRKSSPADYQPDPLPLVDRFPNLRLGVLKLSPMLDDAYLESLGECLQFLSFKRECREALVLMGQEAVAGRSVVHVETGGKLNASDRHLSVTDAPQEWLLEADPAAIRAHTIGDLAMKFELSGLGNSNGYLTGNHAPESPWLTKFFVLGHGVWDSQKIKKELEALGSTTPILKQRGADLDLTKLGKQFRVSGKRPTQLAFYKVGQSLRYAILESR